ncbi:hypothetical protein ACJD0Z_11245 [Flavobacteriaceae bacterium M23B6Z8]
MKQKKNLRSLRFKKKKIASLNNYKGGADLSVIPFTVQRTCLSLIGYYTCETGLHETCDESIKVCPIDH